MLTSAAAARPVSCTGNLPAHFPAARPPIQPVLGHEATPSGLFPALGARPSPAREGAGVTITGAVLGGDLYESSVAEVWTAKVPVDLRKTPT
ncbi:hypothetical protein VTO73DRAFT_7224 [Trametes versicolor]